MIGPRNTWKDNTPAASLLRQQPFASEPLWTLGGILIYWGSNYAFPPLIFVQAQYALTIALSVLLGLMFQDLSYDLYGIQGRAGCNFFLLCLLSFSCMSSLDTCKICKYLCSYLCSLPRTRFICKRTSPGDVQNLRVFPCKDNLWCYSASSYPTNYIGNSDLLDGGTPSVNSRFWIVLTQPDFSVEYMHYIWSVSVLVLVSLVACSMCLAIGSSCPSMGVSNLVAILLMLFYMLFGGLLANKTTIPPFLNWFKWLSFMNYGYEVLMVNELAGTTVLFNPPNIPPGIIVDCSPKLLVYTTGEEFLTQFDMDPNRVQMDVGILFSMAVFYLIVSYLCLRFYIKERR